jgi:hypothetical protein
VACLMQRLMPSGDRRSPREGTESSWKSSPSCTPGAPSCVLPLLVLHRQGITYRRGCGSLLSATSRWPKCLPRFGRWCLLPWSSRLGTRPTKPFGWKLWASWLPNSRFQKLVELIGPRGLNGGWSPFRASAGGAGLRRRSMGLSSGCP